MGKEHKIYGHELWTYYYCRSAGCDRDRRRAGIEQPVNGILLL